MKKYEGLKLDEERALYAIENAEVENCVFDGPADGESALKESRDIRVKNCDFNLRYPFWHVHRATIEACRMPDTCRAALWYDEDIRIQNCDMNGIKALRECDRIQIEASRIASPEFGWRCRGVKIKDCDLESEYPFFETRDMEIDNLRLSGKYSFQYVENVVIKNSVLDTKDAFWHGKQVTVMDSVIKGEYLAWYSEGLHLIRCKIIGTQPLCYCKDLVLEDCEMVDTDLSFEYSQVQATIKGGIVSVKNPVSGSIEADEIGEVILDEHQRPGSHCVITAKRDAAAR